MVNYIGQNTDFYEAKFKAGYGHHHPESHVIKLYNRVLAPRLRPAGAGGRKLLDFGCSTGCNLVFFASKGFDVYGVDISDTAIDHCRRALPRIADHFEVIPPAPCEMGALFDTTFDVVFANQVLALFSEDDFGAVIRLLHERLAPGGVIVASMAGTGHYYHRRSVPASGGLRKITLADGPDDHLYMRFTDSEERLKRDFDLFEPLAVGYYDINLCDDSGFHYVFVGRK